MEKQTWRTDLWTWGEGRWEERILGMKMWQIYTMEYYLAIKKNAL